MAAKPTLRYGSKASRLLIAAAQITALIAAWLLYRPIPAVFRLSLLYVAAPAMVAGGIALLAFLSFSLAPFAGLRAASLDAAANVMWLVPGTLLLTARSRIAEALGVIVVVNSARLLASSRVPRGERISAKRRVRKKSRDLLFRSKAEYHSRDALATILGAVFLEAGVAALAAGYSLLAAFSFVAATAIWVALAVSRGAMEARLAAVVPYPVPGLILTLLLTATLAAGLLHGVVGLDSRSPIGWPAMTRLVVHRLVQVPPDPVAPQVETGAAPALVTRIVGRDGVPGIVLRPSLPRSQTPRLALPRSYFRFSLEQPVAIAFTGEYLLYPASSHGMPREATVQTGDPLGSLFGTDSGSPIETVALQKFDPPVDLAQCGKVLVEVHSAEDELVLASMQFDAGGSVQDSGADLMGMKRSRDETLEFAVPAAATALPVNAIRILFQRAVTRNKSTRVIVRSLTLIPLGR